MTTGLLATSDRHTKPELLRKALYGWAFNTRLRRSGPPPSNIAAAITWLERNTVPLPALADPDMLRQVLNHLARKHDGTPAAATVVARKRAVLYNVSATRSTRSTSRSTRWPRSAGDPRRSPTRSTAAASSPPPRPRPSWTPSPPRASGRHLVAFFGCLYHGGLRPAEAVMLTLDELQLPEKDSGWGWLYLGDSAPSTGGAWNELRPAPRNAPLKHRAAKEVRQVPVSPAFGRLLMRHIAEHGTAPDGRLFRGEDGGLISDSVYSRIWEKARQAALTPAEAASPLAERPTTCATPACPRG